MGNLKFVVDEVSSGTRLDVFLSSNLEEVSRSYIQGIIEDENVTVNGKYKKSNFKLKRDDVVEAIIPDPVDLDVQPENIALDILYEDADVIVVNKAQGMVVHPASGVYNGTLVNALLYHCKDLSGINGVMRPGIVHRIDKDTSGVLVVAKNDIAHNRLAEQLKEHSMTRVYYALTEGVMKNQQGRIEAPLARHPVDKIKMAVVQGGKEAVTNYKVIENFSNNSLVECRLETGRTHQIRVHMAYIGHPIVGDPVYGYKKQRFNLNGQLLHAKVLGFIHPSSKEYMEFQAPLPEHFSRVVDILKNEYKRSNE